MSVRLYLPGILWFGIMVVIFLTPELSQNQLVFGHIPVRAFINCFMFLGLVHISIGALKKQVKYERLRRHAFKLVISKAVFLALIVELTLFMSNNSSFGYWNLIFDIIGSFLGIVSFKLLYRSCY